MVKQINKLIQNKGYNQKVHIIMFEESQKRMNLMFAHKIFLR